jgi:ABC-type multidrug transport system ATPase subunit
LILDDVFSGLDTVTEERVFSRLLGRNGLLRQLSCTVILVTHAAHRLSYAENIVALGARGTVLEQGSFRNLVQRNGYVAGLAARHTEEREGAPKEELPPAKINGGPGEDVAAELNHSVGSWAIYNYYFTGVVRRTVVAWSILMIAYSILLRFPGKLTQLSFRYTLSTRRYLDQVLYERHCSPQ